MPNEVALRTIWNSNGQRGVMPTGRGRAVAGKRSLMAQGKRVPKPRPAGPPRPMKVFRAPQAPAQRVGSHAAAIFRQIGMVEGKDYVAAGHSISLAPSGASKIKSFARKVNGASRDLLRKAQAIEQRMTLERDAGKQAYLLNLSDEAFRKSSEAANVAAKLDSMMMGAPGVGMPWLLPIGIASVVLIGLSFLGFGPAGDAMRKISAEATAGGKAFFESFWGILQFALWASSLYAGWYFLEYYVSPTVEGFREGRVAFKTAFKAGKEKRRKIGLFGDRGLLGGKASDDDSGTTSSGGSTDDGKQYDLETVADPKERQRVKNMLSCVKSVIKNKITDSNGRRVTLAQWSKLRSKGGPRAPDDFLEKYDTCVREMAKAYKKKHNRQMPKEILPPKALHGSSKKDFAKLWRTMSGYKWTTKRIPGVASPWHDSHKWLK